MEDRDRINAIADMIQEYWGKKEGREKRRISLNDLAVHFGVNPTSLSYWHRRVREPDYENKQRLARKIGYVRFYEAIGEQPRMPGDPDIVKLLSVAVDDNVSVKELDWAIKYLEYLKDKRGKKKEEPAGAS